MKQSKGVLTNVRNSDIKSGKLVFPDGCTSIKNHAFAHCGDLRSIVIPDSCTLIEYSAFYSCYNLKSIVIPDSCTLIRHNVFLNCIDLISIVIGEKKLNTKCVDNDIFVILSERKKGKYNIIGGYMFNGVFDGKILKVSCYVAEKDGFSAHGYTIKKAIEDLEFKIISDKIQKKPIEADTVIDIKYYRTITGSCELGVNKWIKDNRIKKKKFKAKDLLPILEKTNAYGLDKFKSLVSF